MPLTPQEREAIIQQYGSNVGQDIAQKFELEEAIERANKGENVDLSRYGASNVSDLRMALGETNRQLGEKLSLQARSGLSKQEIVNREREARELRERVKELNRQGFTVDLRTGVATARTGGLQATPQEAQAGASLVGRGITPQPTQGVRTGIVPESLVASSERGPSTFITSRGRIVEQTPASFQVLPVTTPASSLQQERFIEVRKKSIVSDMLGRERTPRILPAEQVLTRPQIESVLTGIPTEKLEALERFEKERFEAATRLQQRDPIGFAIGSGVKGLVGTGVGIGRLTGQFIFAPGKGIELIIGSGKRFAERPEFTVREFLGQTKKEFERDPSEFVISSTTAGVALGPIFKPFVRASRTTFSKIEEKISPKFLRESNIELVIGQPPRAPLKELLKFEGREVEVIHTTPSFSLGTTSGKIKQIITGKKEKVIIERKPGVGGTRAEIEEFSFFRSPPSPITGKPRAFLFFGGVGPQATRQAAIPLLPDLAKQPKTVFTIFKPSPKLLIEKTRIEPTGLKPGTDVVKILAEQEKLPGRTFVAAQNIAKETTEAQFTSPARVLSFPKTGRRPSPGSILELENEEGFLFFREKVGPSFLPKALQESPFFVETTKLRVLRTKTLPGDPIASVIGFKPKAVNLVKDFPIEGERGIRFITVSERTPELTLGLKRRKGSVVRERRVLLEEAREPFLRRDFARELTRIRGVPTERFLRIGEKDRIRVPGRERLGVPEFRRPIITTEQPPISFREPRLPPPNRLILQPPTRIISPTPSLPRITIQPPRPPGPPFLPPPPVRREKELFKEKFRLPIEPGFVTVLFRGGKPFKALPGTFTFKEAIARGKKETGLSRLLRSFKVFPVKQLARPRGITAPVGERFRFGKRDPALFVEESFSALSTRAERSLIQEARRRKKTGRGFFQ